MSSPWLVPVTALRRQPGARRPEHRQASLGQLHVADTVVPADHDVEVDVMLTVVDGGIEAEGTVRTRWMADCRRCLRPVSGTLCTPVRELYRPHGSPADEDDEETYELGADHLDLSPLARDAVLLGLPLAPLCREDCAGLCPTCGADLAAGDCGCGEPAPDPRWAALDALRPARAADDGGKA